jgi:hypothetical protein
MIDISTMDANEFVGYCMAKSLWPDDEASFEREWLRCKHQRELRALREKHEIQKQGNKRQCRQ